jgi:hypothetical protein
LIEKKFSIEQEDFDNALKVAKHQHRPFSEYVRHCVLIETSRQLPKAMAKLEKQMPSPHGDTA